MRQRKKEYEKSKVRKIKSQKNRHKKCETERVHTVRATQSQRMS